MSYFLCSNCPLSLGTPVAGPALLLGTETYCLCSSAHWTVPSASASSQFLFHGIGSAPERRGRAGKWKDFTAPTPSLLISQILEYAILPLMPKEPTTRREEKAILWQLSGDMQTPHKWFFWKICAESISALPSESQCSSEEEVA